MSRTGLGQPTRRGALAGGAALAALLGLQACGPLAPGDEKAALDALLDRIAKEILTNAPELATSLAVPETMTGGPYRNRMSDRSQAAVDADNARVGAWIEALEQIDPARLEPADAVSRNVVLSAARYAHAGALFGFGDAGFSAPTPYVVTQLNGAYLSVPDFLDSQHPVPDQAGADAWLARLDGFAGQIAAETARITRDGGMGVIPPDFIIDRTLGLLRGVAAQPPAESVLVTGLARKAGEAGLDVAALTAAATGAVTDKVMPALQAQIAALEALRPRAVSNAGVESLPQGRDYYAAALAYWTTTTKTPDQVHQLGLDLVAALNAEMDTGLKALGLTEGSVGERMSALGRRPEYVYPDTDAGKAQLIGDLNAQMQALEARLPEVFATLPRAPVEVKRIPAYTEDGAPGGYYQPPAPDGSRPGAYYINLRDTAAWPKWSLPTLTYHEAEPGHHFQISVAQEAQGLPFVRANLLWLGGYGEGWALYAEQLADEIGMYRDDPAGRLGYLQSMAFRAARCVVDTGLHAKQWTREQAVDYMVQATGDTRESIVTEVERYCVWPGQATCYMVGKVAIMEARERARRELGDRFDIKGFHDAVLLGGALPLDVLDTVVDAWVARTKAA